MKGIWKLLLMTCVGIVLISLPGLSQLPSGIPREQTLIIDQLTGRTAMPNNFNSWAGWRWRDRGTAQLLNEPLWTVDYATDKIIPGLAADLPIYNKDFTQMTIHLRKGVYWNDGVPFTADDVVFTIEFNKDTAGLVYHGPMNKFVKNVRKIDDYTVVIELKEPNSRFHSYFLDRWGCLWVMPKHIFEKVKDPLKFKFNPPVGCGPYKLYDYDPTGFWTLWVRRKDWNRTPTGILYGKPQPKYVLVRAFESEEARILAQVRHELDMGQFTPEGIRTVLEKNPTARAWRKKWPWVVNIDPCVTGIMLNNQVFPYNIKDVRWALVLAIDPVKYMEVAFDLMAPMSPIHIPPVPAYRKSFFKPMEKWLKNFTLDLGNGKTFKPYDPEVPYKLAKAARERGYPVPKDPEVIQELFGIGWWKYAPDIAAELLEKHGFSKDKNGKWHLPDGSLWKISILTSTNPAHHEYRNATAAAELWREFGIDTTVQPSEQSSTLHMLGKFKVGTQWPAAEPWGVGVDLYRTFRIWHSRMLTPIGKPTVMGPGGAARWSDPRLDKIIEKMETTNAFTEKEKARLLGIEALKIAVEDMPTIPMYGYCGALVWDEYYWTNWPGAENPYCQPYHHWPNLKYMPPFLRPTGRTG